MAGAELPAGLDGFDVWEAITSDGPSPRTELLHNIDPLSSPDKSHGFGTSAIRKGDFKLIIGEPGQVSGWLIPPGCPARRCPPIQPRVAPECANDTAATTTWLFNITADPSERCNLAASMPETVGALLRRLSFYNRTAVPALDPPNDPAADPSRHSGSEKGAWGPWR